VYTVFIIVHICCVVYRATRHRCDTQLWRWFGRCIKRLLTYSLTENMHELSETERRTRVWRSREEVRSFVVLKSWEMLRRPAPHSTQTEMPSYNVEANVNHRLLA